MDWFYDKTLALRVDGETLDELTGIYVPNKQNINLVFKGDVQPADNEKIYDENGKMIEYNYRVYCDKNFSMIQMLEKPAAIIFYNNRNYSIEKITDWDDYYIFYIKARQ